jgi:uncharacterized protein YkwD
MIRAKAIPGVLIPVLLALTFLSAGCATVKPVALRTWDTTKRTCLTAGLRIRSAVQEDLKSSSSPSASPASAGTRTSPAGWDSQELDTARNASYLTEAEKDVIFEMNKLRSDPARYANEYLVPMRGRFSGLIYSEPGQIDLRTEEGVRALDECIAELGRTEPVPPMYPSRGLWQAARDHAADQGRTGQTGHTGSDGSTMQDRMNRYGKWDITCGENISYGCDSGRKIVVQLVVDDGVPSRGHRKNLLAERFLTAGASIGPHPVYGKVCVIDYAGLFSDR